MESLGIALIITGGLILRQVAVGRATSIGGDTKDFFTALLHGDTATLSEVAARRGQNLPPEASISIQGAVTSALGAVVANSYGGKLIAEMKRLADIANHTYVLGAEGPAAYDCSGLVWRALYNLKFYTGPRFTTFSFDSVAPRFAARVTDAPNTGDIVIWPHNPGHMGVVVGPDSMFSALNKKDGIVTSRISSIHGETPQYWRMSTATVGGK